MKGHLKAMCRAGKKAEKKEVNTVNQQRFTELGKVWVKMEE